MMLSGEISVEFDVPATMRDGTVLRSNVYRPADDGEYPVLLSRLPYDKNGPRDAVYFDPLKAARSGYIVVVQDVRGRFASDGDFDSFLRESEDGYDAVEWAAGLPGSTGLVGMWGLSYYGKTQWHAAVEAPPSLAAITPGQTWGNHLNGASLRGGAQELGLVHSWAQGAIAPDYIAKKYAAEPEIFRERMAGAVGVIDELAKGSGLGKLPYSELPDPEGLDARLHIGRDVSDGFWDSVNLDGRYGDVSVPTLHIGGWYDCFIGETLLQYARMKSFAEKTGTPPPRLVVGPWTHADFGSGQGDLDFGVLSSGAFLDAGGTLSDLQLRFMDEVLKGDISGTGEPPVKVFVMGENRWRSLDEWPPADSTELDLHFGGGGTLTRESPGSSEASYDYDPLSPVPTLGGQTLLPAAFGAGPLDQRPVEAREDVLVFTSEPLDDDMTLLGPVSATLFAASSAPDTDFVVRLTDVHPDGRSIVITDGIVRASARETYPSPGVITPTRPSPIEPGRVYEYSLDLWQTALTITSGHRLRVHVTSSCFPRWDRNLNTGASGHDSGETSVAAQTVLTGGEHPSRVTITTVSRDL